MVATLIDVRRKLDMVAAYRYLDYEFDHSSAVDSMNVSGPLVGVKFTF